MLPTRLDFETCTLGASLCFAAYLTHRCWSPPNPAPTVAAECLPEDTVGISSEAVQGRRFLIVMLWLLHLLITFSYPSPSALLCPNPNNLSSSLFTWSSYTARVLGVILLAAPIRLLAFKQLGQNFTFRLARPKSLVTTGLYAYVQHPSYPTNWLIMTSNIALLFRLDGVVGCMLPVRAVSWGMKSGGFKIWPAFLVWLSLSGLYVIWIRVKDEEAMLRKEFGKEWEEYHQRTKRFVPGVM